MFLTIMYLVVLAMSLQRASDHEGRFDSTLLCEAYSVYNERTKTLEEYILVAFNDSSRNLIPVEDHVVVEASSDEAESGETILEMQTMQKKTLQKQAILLVLQQLLLQLLLSE